MKAICIDDSFHKEKGTFELKKGNVYNIIEESHYYDIVISGYRIENGIYYKLIESPSWYHNSIFVIINEEEIDEKEFKRNNILVKNV